MAASIFLRKDIRDIRPTLPSYPHPPPSLLSHPPSDPLAPPGGRKRFRDQFIACATVVGDAIEHVDALGHRYHLVVTHTHTHTHTHTGARAHTHLTASTWEACTRCAQRARYQVSIAGEGTAAAALTAQHRHNSAQH